MDYYSTGKRKCLTHAMTRIKLENNRLSGISQSQKDTYHSGGSCEAHHVAIFIEQSRGIQGLGRRGGGGLLKEYRDLVSDDAKALVMDTKCA